MTTADSATATRAEAAAIVKRMLITESRITMDPEALSGGEPLTGPVLNVSSFGFVGMFIRLEDELGVELPDDLFIDRVFTTVDDVVTVVADAVARGGAGQVSGAAGPGSGAGDLG